MKSILIPAATAELLAVQATSEISEAWQNGYGIDLGDPFRLLGNIQRCRCCATGFEFYLPVEAAGDSAFYENLQKIPWYYMADKWEHSAVLSRLHSSDRVLELGCGEGAFLRRLAQSGFADVTGTELNEQARVKGRKSGLKIEAPDYLQSLEAGFDVICSFQVLEHISNPSDFLDGAVKQLHRGGRLFISVPNNRSFIRHDKEDLFNQPPHHMGRWSGSVFRAIAPYFQLRLESLSYEPLASYHVDWYIRILEKAWLGGATSGGVPSLPFRILRKLLFKFPRMRRLIRGHTILAEFVRL